MCLKWKQIDVIHFNFIFFLCYFLYAVYRLHILNNLKILVSTNKFFKLADVPYSTVVILFDKMIKVTIFSAITQINAVKGYNKPLQMMKNGNFSIKTINE